MVAKTKNAVDPSKRAAGLEHYEVLARIGRAMSSPARLQLLDLLRQGPRSVETLAEHAGLSVANVSQHLQQLRTARFVVGDKQGQRVVYSLASDSVGRFFALQRQLGEELLPELDRLRDVLDVQDEAVRSGLLAEIAAGDAFLIDVRPREEFVADSLPGALHIPLGELPVRLDELAKERSYIAYCRGPYCPLASAAVDVLRDAGFRARHLDLAPADVVERSVGHRSVVSSMSPGGRTE